MKKTLIILLLVFIGLQHSCIKEIDDECVNCYCFNFVEPLRLSYQDKDSLDLLGINEIVIDSILGHIYTNTDTADLSDSLLNMKFDIRNWVGAPKNQFRFSFIEFDLDLLVGFYNNNDNETITKGIGMDHEFYIYTNIGIDTINVRWDILLTTVEGCCNDCVSFPNAYIKYNNNNLTEGTKTGAAIIRK